MIKKTLIFFIATASLFISAVLADGVVIDHMIPTSLEPGEKTTVSVNINKGEVTGFAKLQLEIPAGLTARAIKKSGASFTFSGQKAKFIWMSLPDTQEFSVEYELEANSAASGSKVVSGQFSYIKQNERVDYDLAPKVINIGSEVIADNSTLDNSTNGSDAICNRIVTQVSQNEWFVELSATNVETDGFAKMVEDISTGFTITEDKSGESIVTLEEDRIKFVWFEKPTDDSYSVSYTLTSNDGDKTPEITGELSIVLNNSPVEIPVVNQEMISSRDFSGGDQNLADNTTEDSNDSDNSEEETADNSASENSTNDTSGTEDQVENSSNYTANNSGTEDSSSTEENDSTVADNNGSITDIPDPETGITYKVQLAATHKYINASTFKKTQNLDLAIQTENHEGWTKFVTGSHGVYKAARDSRNDISLRYKKLNGPFVTAYNSGERITVQEALMISKQKWYQ